MITPNNRRVFERHINILFESIEKGRFKAVPNRRMQNGLLNARLLPNRRINFLTIDESTRLLANSLTHFQRAEFKKMNDAEQ